MSHSHAIKNIAQAVISAKYLVENYQREMAVKRLSEIVKDLGDLEAAIEIDMRALNECRAMIEAAADSVNSEDEDELDEGACLHPTVGHRKGRAVCVDCEEDLGEDEPPDFNDWYDVKSRGRKRVQG